MRLLYRSFENPVTEEYDWLTNIMTSDNGTEQRAGLLDPPRRMLTPDYVFTSLDDARRLVRDMIFGQTGFLVPAFHQGVKMSPAAIGARAILFDARKTELRDGMQAFIYDRIADTFEVVTIGVVSANGATLTGPLVGAWGPRAMIAPVWALFGGDNATVSRGNVNADIKASMTLNQLSFIDPFLNPFNEAELTYFGDLPLLEINSVGTQFDIAFNTGATLIDYGAAVTIRSRWNYTQEVFSRDFLCQKAVDPAGWEWWRKFLDYCKGSLNPFYLPTFREDFEIVGVAAGDMLTLRGTDYATEFYPNPAFKQFAIFTGAGRHYTAVTAVASVGGNTLCTIDPPLPAGAGYATKQGASLLMKTRIDDDKATCLHDPLQTIITLNMRTVRA